MPTENVILQEESKVIIKELPANIIMETECSDIDELLLMVEQRKSIKGKRICGIEMVHLIGVLSL